MSNNATQMTLEEKLVQTIKERELFALLGDEDAITKLVERAIREALYQPRRASTTSYGSFSEKDSPLVEAARSIASEVARKVAEREIEALLTDESTGPLVRKFLVEALPMALVEALVRKLTAYHHNDMSLASSLLTLANQMGVQMQQSPQLKP